MYHFLNNFYFSSLKLSYIQQIQVEMHFIRNILLDNF